MGILVADIKVIQLAMQISILLIGNDGNVQT